MPCIPYCAPSFLVNELDTLVKDPKDPYFLEIKAEIEYRLNRLNNFNPFHAGRKRTYTDEDMIKAADMHRQGLTYEKISQELGYSKATISRMIDRKYRFFTPSQRTEGDSDD